MLIDGKQLRDSSVADGKLVEDYILANGTRAFTGLQDMGGFRITNAQDPVNPQDYATMAYVDAAVVGAAAVPTISNKEMAASITAADGQVATATGMAFTPAFDGYVRVFVNGTGQVLGNGVKTKDSYFSGDGGTTARAISAIIAGDLLYWNGSIAGFQLAANDLIDFDYAV